MERNHGRSSKEGKEDDTTTTNDSATQKQQNLLQTTKTFLQSMLLHISLPPLLENSLHCRGFSEIERRMIQFAIKLLVVCVMIFVGQMINNIADK